MIAQSLLGRNLRGCLPAVTGFFNLKQEHLMERKQRELVAAKRIQKMTDNYDSQGCQTVTPVGSWRQDQGAEPDHPQDHQVGPHWHHHCHPQQQEVRSDDGWKSPSHHQEQETPQKGSRESCGGGGEPMGGGRR